MCGVNLCGESPRRCDEAAVLAFHIWHSAGASVAAFAQQTSSEHAVRAVLNGRRVAVFDTAKDSCGLIDIPDTQARAFRDYKGMIHLVSSHYVMRANLGPTLESVKHNCQVAYSSNHDGNPANFDDTTWLNAFYTLDGKRMAALGHVEYHGWEHKGMCATKTDNSACWYNGDTLHVSEDGGYHFGAKKAPASYVAALPYKYEVNKGPEGYSVDTNIIKSGEWYYAMVTDWPWPANCTEGKGPQPCLVPFGGSPIRTKNLFDASSWRGWNGKDFAVSFVDPYQNPVPRPADHVYTPVPYMYYVNAINYSRAVPSIRRDLVRSV
jgi:hypothetical protein